MILLDLKLLEAICTFSQECKLIHICCHLLSLIIFKPQSFSQTQSEIIIEFTPEPATSYKLCWKEAPQPWTEAESKFIHFPTTSSTSSSSPAKIRVEAADLIPSTSYCLRLIKIDAESRDEIGDYGPELIVDTEAVGCTPGQKSCCVVQ